MTDTHISLGVHNAAADNTTVKHTGDVAWITIGELCIYPPHGDLINRLQHIKAIGQTIADQALDALDELADNATDTVDLTAEFDTAQARHWTRT